MTIGERQHRPGADAADSLIDIASSSGAASWESGILENAVDARDHGLSDARDKQMQDLDDALRWIEDAKPAN